MPIYEYRCSECESLFEIRRPAADRASPAPACPNGHAAARRVLSVFATAGRSVGASSGPAPNSAGCGPGCACAANA